jgi:CyaY protein
MLDEQEFHRQSDEALRQLQRAREAASDKYDFDVDRSEGALTIEFEEPRARFVVSPNSPVRQIWVSARVRSFKLDWVPEQSAFVLADGRSLRRLISDVVSEQLGEVVSL